MLDHEVAKDLTRTMLGIDALFRAERAAGPDQLDREGLVPVHWSPLEPQPFAHWHEAVARLRTIVEAASVLTDGHARDWLTEQSLSILTLVRWLKADALAIEPPPYEAVVAGTLRVDPRPPSAGQLARAREDRDRAALADGFASYEAYLEATTVPAAQVGPVMRALIAEAHARTLRRLPHLRLRDDVIGVKDVSGTAFSAYCDYPGRAVWINTDVPFTRPELKHLVAHEAYPGHDAHMAHRDALVRDGAMLADGALVITNTASSVLFEGIAELGLDLLGWRNEPGDRVAWAQARLEWWASIEVAHGLNTGRLTPAEAARLLRTTCDGDEAWIEAKLRFVTHPVRAPFVYGYWWGGTVVGAWWRRVRAARFDDAIRHLYDRMHSPTTLGAHWHEEDPT